MVKKGGRYARIKSVVSFCCVVKRRLTPMKKLGGRTMWRRVFVCLLVLGLCGHVSAGLVGYWALDGNATDSSDYGNHGTINGNVAPAAA